MTAKDVALLKEPTMRAVAADKDALKPALIIVAAVSVLGALGYWIFPTTFGANLVYRPDLMWLLGQALSAFVASVVALYLTGYLAVHLFKSKLPMEGFVRAGGYGMIVGALSVIPAVSLIGAVWTLVIFWSLLSKLAKLEVVEIIVLFVIDIVAFAFISMLFVGW